LSFEIALNGIPVGYSTEEVEIRRLSHLVPQDDVAAQTKYADLVAQALRNDSEAGVIANLRGISLELSRMWLLQQVGVVVDFSLNQDPMNVRFNALDRNVRIAEDGTPNGTYSFVKKEDIDLDIPFTQDGKVYVYETKWVSRSPFGCRKNQWNQMRKYLAALQNGQVSGVTYEAAGGLIAVEPLKYLLASNFQLVYAFPLPSGGEWRVNLAPPHSSDIPLHNLEVAEEDTEMVVAIERLVAEPNRTEKVLALFTGFKHPRISDPSDEIQSRQELADYTAWFQTELWRRLSA